MVCEKEEAALILAVQPFILVSVFNPLPLSEQIQQMTIFFFPRKQELTLHANCLNWRQFV